MHLQACDRFRRDLISLPPANKSMIYSKISSGSVFIIVVGQLEGHGHGDGESHKSRA